MKTVYNKVGKPFVLAQDIDALKAVQSGHYFAVPPGKKLPPKREEAVGKEAMTAQQLVDYAKEKFGADLDPLIRKDMLVKMVEELENPKEIEFIDKEPDEDETKEKELETSEKEEKPKKKKPIRRKIQ